MTPDREFWRKKNGGAKKGRGEMKEHKPREGRKLDEKGGCGKRGPREKYDSTGCRKKHPPTNPPQTNSKKETTWDLT